MLAYIPLQAHNSLWGVHAPDWGNQQNRKNEHQTLSHSEDLGLNLQQII